MPGPNLVQEGVAHTVEGAELAGTWVLPGEVHTNKDWASRLNDCGVITTVYSCMLHQCTYTPSCWHDVSVINKKNVNVMLHQYIQSSRSADVEHAHDIFAVCANFAVMWAVHHLIFCQQSKTWPPVS